MNKVHGRILNRGEGRIWDYTLGDIAAIIGKSVYTVRRHRREGVFDPSSLEDVVEYIIKYLKKD